MLETEVARRRGRPRRLQEERLDRDVGPSQVVAQPGGVDPAQRVDPVGEDDDGLPAAAPPGELHAGRRERIVEAGAPSPMPEPLE